MLVFSSRRVRLKVADVLSEGIDSGRGAQTNSEAGCSLFAAPPAVDQLSRSMINAIPWPPPTHIVIRPVVLSCQSRELSIVFCNRAPVMPNG